MFYSRIPLKYCAHTERMLKSQVGSFIGPNGNMFYKCVLTNVNYSDSVLHAKWHDIHNIMDINNFEAAYQLTPGYALKKLDESIIDPFVCKLNGKNNIVYLPYTVRSGDTILFTHEYFVNECFKVVP